MHNARAAMHASTAIVVHAHRFEPDDPARGYLFYDYMGPGITLEIGIVIAAIRATKSDGWFVDDAGTIISLRNPTCKVWVTENVKEVQKLIKDSLQNAEDMKKEFGRVKNY